MNDRPTPERLAEIRRSAENHWYDQGYDTDAAVADLLSEIDVLTAERDERPTAIVQFDGSLTEAGYREFAERWCEVVDRDKSKPLRILTPDPTDYTGFAFLCYEAVEMVCIDCNRGPTLAEDRELFNLAGYMAWADRHRCEVRT